MLIQEVLGFYHSTIEMLSSGDSTVKGFMTLGIMGMLGYLGRAIPQSIWTFVKRNTISSMTFTRAGSYSMDMQNYVEFMRWFSQSKWAKYDRNRRVTFDRNDPAFGPGTGFHWFIWKGRYFWFNVVRLNSSGTDIEKEEFTLYTFGRTTIPFEELVEEFRIKPCKDSVRIYAPANEGWGYQGRLRLDADETLIIDPQVEKEFFGSIDWYLANEPWYRKRGLAYKHTIVLHGPPGTGKTSLIKRGGRKYKRDIHFLNLATHGRSLTDLMGKLSPGDMLVIEDFDDVKSLHRRVGPKKMEITDFDGGGNDKKPEALLMDCEIQLSTFLNVLQGVVELDDIIIVLTTNHLELIDPAVYRPSRVNKLIEVLPLKDPEVKRYIDTMYDNPTYDRNVMYPDVPASTLAGIFMEHPNDHLAFIDKLNTLDDKYVAENYALQPEPPRLPSQNKGNAPVEEVAPALEAA